MVRDRRNANWTDGHSHNGFKHASRAHSHDTWRREDRSACCDAPPPVTEVPDATNRAEKVWWQGAWEPDCVVADPEDLENPWADMSEQDHPFWIRSGGHRPPGPSFLGPTGLTTRGQDFTEGSLSLKPESISYCNEIQAKFDNGGDVDGEYKGWSPEEKLLFFWILSK